MGGKCVLMAFMRCITLFWNESKEERVGRKEPTPREQKCEKVVQFRGAKLKVNLMAEKSAICCVRHVAGFKLGGAF